MRTPCTLLRPDKLLPLAAMALNCAAILAQIPEVPRPVEHPVEHPVGEPARDGTSSEHDILLKDGHINGNVKLRVPGEHPPLMEARHVDWLRTRNPDGTPSYGAYEVSEASGAGTSGRRLLTLDDLRTLYNSGQPVVNSGDVPNGSKWRELTASKGEFTVIHEKGSANRDWAAISEATALADHPLTADRTVIFNALPQETAPEASERERTRMGIVGSTGAWKTVNEMIHKASEGFQSHVATKQALLDELEHGTSDVIVVYAHFDGVRLHLPGGSGANHGSLSDHTISVEEIAGIDRVKNGTAKNRVIVLAACSTAKHTPNVDSLVQVLLKQGIARTVLATDRPYDARDIPELMQRLNAQVPPRKAGGQLRQYVELRPLGRPLPWLLFNFEPELLTTGLYNPLQESEMNPGE